MGYIYLDDHFDEHPKVLAAGPRAAWLYICGLLYCHRNMTPGTIPKQVVPGLIAARTWREHVGKLQQSGLWIEHAHHYEVNDYMQWNARQFEKREQAKRAAQARWHPSKTDADAYAERNAGAHADAHAPAHADAMPTDPRNQGTTKELSSVTNSRPRALTDEDEDRIETEARRRMNQLPTAPNHPTAWLAVTKANIRREHDQNIRWQPKDPPNAQRRDYDHPNPECKTCGSTGWLKIFNTDAVTPCQACK